MRINLFIKYLLCYLLVVLTSLVVLNTVGKKRIEEAMVRSRLSSMAQEAETITKSYMEGYYSSQMSVLELDNKLKVIDTFAGVRILIVNPKGIVTSDSRGNQTSEQRMVIPDWLLERDFSMGRETSLLFRERSLVSIYPIDIDFVLKGYILLVMPMADILQDASYHLETLNISFLILDALFLFVLTVLYRISIIPLRAVLKASREYSVGNLNYKFPTIRKRNDEFNDLMDTIQFMASELNSMEEYQRKFISNISHDFRSPLTSIKGFATAMMDGTIPPELYNKYLNTICFETDRLTKLTSGLMELGKFDSKVAMLNLKDFDINSIIKSTAEVFEGSCREKMITLNLIFENEVEPVYADKGKIQQVLYNLLDNAIKFSNFSSEINISTREKGNKVFVSVKDYGVGISKDSLKRIWERFYKSDTSRGKDKKGSGLGLAIVKEIIQSHGEEINVISTENAGSEFVFTLNKAEV